MTLEKGRRDPSVFLADDLENEPEPEGIVKKYYKMIFEYELHEWMTPEETWPRNRELRTFLEWFDVDICTMVIDLSRVHWSRNHTDDLPKRRPKRKGS